MSLTLKLDNNGDLDFVNNNFVLVTGITALRDRIFTNLRTFQGEWFLDPALGVPYFEQVFGKQVNVGALYTIFSGAIRRTRGVAALNRLEFDLNNSTRQLNIQFNVTANDGVKLEETFVIGV